MIKEKELKLIFLESNNEYMAFDAETDDYT